jgi:hypothetical protein
MKETRTTHRTMFVLLALLALFCAPSALKAAEKDEPEKRKIPVEIEEPEVKVPRTHKAAMGIAIDPFPIIMSAVDGRFGLSVQPWFGIDYIKVRIDITHVRIPNAITGTKYFYKNENNIAGIVAEGFFNKNFDGFRIGTGIGLWDTTISRRYFNKKGKSISAYWTIEGGYVWKFYKTLYIEPCLSLDVPLSQNRISLYGSTYRQLPVIGEISLKFGLYFDI